MSNSTTKLYYLEFLCERLLEVKDIIAYFPGETGLFSQVGDRILSITGSDDTSRKQRAAIFLEWLMIPDDSINKYQQFVDVLSKEDLNYRWLIPLLTDCEFDENCIKCFNYIQKPDKIKEILQVIYPALENIDVSYVIQLLRQDLSDNDRQEIENITSQLSNQRGLYALLNKLIYKAPGWMERFIKVIRDLNYNAAIPMFSDAKYNSLADALEDYFVCFDQDAITDEMMIVENPEAMNEEAVSLMPKNDLDKDFPSCSSKQDCQSMFEDVEDKMKNTTIQFQSTNEEPKSTTQASIKYELRNYQKEMCKLALVGKNVIICERTGSGKTRVAAQIIGDHLDGNVQKIGQCKDLKIAFFTPTGGLAEEQYEKMKDYLPRVKRIEMLRGNIDDDQLGKNFQKRIYSADLIVMTPRILLNCLEDKSVKSVFDFSMMIFDECHHARAMHPYTEILKKYLEEKKTNEKEIHIIGMTATLGVGSATNLEEAKNHIFKLLGIMDAEEGIVYVKEPENEDELNIVCHIASEESVSINTADEDSYRQIIRKAIGRITSMMDITGVFKDLNDLNSDLKDKLNHVGNNFESWCCKLRHAAGALSKEDSTLGRDARSCADALLCLNSAYALCYNCHSSDAIKKIEEFAEKNYVDECEKNTKIENDLHELMNDALDELTNCGETKNDTLDVLERKILKKSENDVSFRCMMMVSRRYFAGCLKKWMLEDENLKHFKPEIYIGVGNKSSSDCPGMSQKAQRDVVGKFKKGESKVLICTPDAAGEGLDFPDCNLVITVNCVKSEILKAQLGGRVRAKNGEVVNIYFGDNQQRDKLTGEKLQLMEKAKREIHKMSQKKPDDYRNKMKHGQKQALDDFNQALMKKNQVGPISQTNGDSLVCRKCNAFVCKTTEIIRMNGNHHTVNREDFKKKYSASIHNLQGKKCGDSSMTHVNKIRCAECKFDWGNEVIWKDYLMPIIKIKGFKIISGYNRKIFQPSKWKATRLKILEKSRDKSIYERLFTIYVKKGYSDGKSCESTSADFDQETGEIPPSKPSPV